MLNFTEPVKGDQIAELETTEGTIKLMFFPSVAPKAVENFLTHAQNGYYDGVIFHRVIKDFMIQSGDPQGTGRGGESIWGKVFKNEISDEARNFRGALAMANAGPGTNGSQFYIVQAGADNISDSFLSRLETQTGKKMTGQAKAKYKEVGGAPWLDGGYTVFGQVFEGMDIVDKIASVTVDGSDKPIKAIKINKITIDTIK